MIADIIVFGAIWTAIYSMIALGFSLIFGVAKILNLAHGALFMFACYSSYLLATSGIGMFWVAMGSVLITIILAILSYWILIKPMRNMETQILIITWAFAMFIEQVIVIGFGPEPRFVPSIFSGGMNVIGVRVTYQQMFAVGVTIVLLLLLWWLLSKTNMGRIIRSVSQDREMASMLGVNAERVSLFVIGLSSAFAAIAGILVAPFLTVTPAMGWSPILVAFTIVVLGGLGNVWGTLLGAVIVAYAEMITSYAITPQLKDAVTFSIMILALIYRPKGLFSKGVSER
ncbi:branched-chain amino acid ABC transporter permease [Bacillus sp. V5-8f]|uniref:branched-chain amino acid ABC transporter permease n=1 Tax=Bacillus sp. V5-8f TaxID=2053044 RepID=UPI000C7878D3|nr:branched-chain amino acid ABC transporter permease [Bacillus sp. V5-8f]PLT33326.1 branched-chain amino acid ABC transporter permease [Bacillus sp. V5-8f]